MEPILLDGGIGIDIQPLHVAEILKNAGGSNIYVKLSSNGGYIYPALLIYNMIKDYEGKTTVEITGLVASAASYILSAFDEIVARDNSIVMIHNTQNGVFGDYRVLEKEAQELKKLNTTIGKAYADLSGKSIKEILALMDKETWLYGSEIIDEGFAHKMLESGAPADKEKELMNAMQKYNAFKPPVIADDIHKAVAMIEKTKAINKKTDIVVDDISLNFEGGDMNREDFLKAIGAMKSNEITLDDIAKAMNASDRLVTPEHIAATKIVAEFKKLKIDDPIAEYKSLKNQVAENAKAIFDARMTKEFGAEKYQNGKENLLRLHAFNQLKDVKADDLDEAIKNLKEKDPIAKELASKLADFSSDANVIGIVDQQKKTAAQTTGRQVDKI
jgi:ATP-dependent protease ClpP protease subunit